MQNNQQEVSNGRSEGMFFSFCQTATGVFLIGTGVWAVPGAMLLGSGLSGGIYALKSEEIDYTHEEYAKKSFVGGFVGGVTGGIGSFFGNSLTVAAASGAVGRVTNDVADAVVHGEELPDASKVATSVLVGALTGGVASGASTYVSSASTGLVRRALDETDDVMSALTRTASGAAGGAAASGASTLASNAVEGKPLTEGLAESIGIGATIGGAISAVQARTQAEPKTTPDKEPPKPDDSQQVKLDKEQAALDAAKKASFDKEQTAVNDAKNANDAYQKEFNSIKKDFKRMAHDDYKFKVGGHYVNADKAAEAYAKGQKVEYKKGKIIINPARVRGDMKMTAIDVDAPTRLQQAENNLNTAKQQNQAQVQHAEKNLNAAKQKVQAEQHQRTLEDQQFVGRQVTTVLPGGVEEVIFVQPEQYAGHQQQGPGGNQGNPGAAPQQGPAGNQANPAAAAPQQAPSGNQANPAAVAPQQAPAVDPAADVQQQGPADNQADHVPAVQQQEPRDNPAAQSPRAQEGAASPRTPPARGIDLEGSSPRRAHAPLTRRHFHHEAQSPQRRVGLDSPIICEVSQQEKIAGSPYSPAIKRFFLLELTIQKYSFGATTKRGFFARPFAELGHVVAEIKDGCLEMVKGLQRIKAIAEGFGANHPILLAANRCIAFHYQAQEYEAACNNMSL